MITRTLAQSARRLVPIVTARSWICQSCIAHTSSLGSRVQNALRSPTPPAASRFHTSTWRPAQSPTADALMENLNDLYSTAKDEFEMASEETEKATIYAEEDRNAAREALTTLKDAFEQATKESDPEVAQEITRRVGPRIRELENAVIAMEERAVEH